ncbi:Helix-turn-helix domain-containing protein [Methylobacterium sp. ap11]|uniref:helix-turn-helix domain-containing protein n=1 Tax=Methylobacterium sp. ap11 TaxID=1761799 RepID=UPI0008C11EA0|nr:helix-turn-helix transcriptional regulator [Methylobacterium sp. ap11]SEP50014.1 Helix-turn-helix domain-containing protein [Methylobacterium sp. ap11]
MSVQSIVTDGGEELVILSRRAYDALLARAGDEDAEDRMTARLAEEHLAAQAAGAVVYAPDWLTAAVLAGESLLAATRRQAGLNLDDLAAKVGVSPEVLTAMEAGSHDGSPALIAAIAQACGVDAALLQDQNAPLARPRRRSARTR